MMRPPFAVTILSALLSAGFAPVCAAAETILSLSETATVTAHPDELVASLRAVASERTPAAAQAQVNAAIAKALEIAKQTAGVQVATGSYSVWREANQPKMGQTAPGWQASQAIELRSRDGSSLLALVGKLQEMGLATGQLEWQLSTEASRRAQAEATAAAIRGLRARADAAAALLDQRVAAFKEVRLDASRPQPMVRAFAAPTAAAGAAVPPSAEAADVPVSATAQADLLLEPR